MIQQTFRPSQLKEIPTEKISRNPDNPRLFFRSDELGSLMASIRRYGIQVPITVFEDDDHFTLIDGERRWRCADKLNIKKMPALILPRPSPLDNLLIMFNIHALREQWDYLTIANKLPDVIDLFKKERGYEPNEPELSEATGLTRGQIRRCRFLLDLPSKYKAQLLSELALPKHKQQLSEDFFIEMERSLKTVQNRVPSAIKDINQVRDALIKKFRKGVIDNVTDFRKLSKIATSISNLGIREAKASSAIREIFDAKNDVSIDEVFSEHFELRYDERKIKMSIESIADFLESSFLAADHPPLDADLRALLRKLDRLIQKVLEDRG